MALPRRFPGWRENRGPAGNPPGTVRAVPALASGRLSLRDDTTLVYLNACLDVSRPSKPPVTSE